MGRPTAVGGDASQAKMRLFESMLLLLRDAARSRGLLLILEDLQWADPATRELLDYATRRLRSTNVLVIATYRTDEMHRKHALLPTIQGWRRNGQVELVDLGSLNAAQVAEMVCAIFEEASITDEFRDFLRDRSEGNPFVLEEMLRDALDRGDIFRTETGWDRKSLAEIRIPPTVRDTILQRLERLTREDVAVLAAASVMGRSFDVASLADVAAVDEATALAALEASVTAQLIEQEDRTSGRYRFRHALTREAIYEDLVVPRRRQLHSRIADVLAARPDRASVDLANHLFMAGRNEEAVAMCVAAAEDAVRAHAYRDAAELLERAAPYAADSVERARMLCRAGTFYWQNTESTNAKRLLQQGIADLDAAGLTVEAAAYRVDLGRCLWELMRSDLAHEQYERARVVLEPTGPSEALAIDYIRLAGLAIFNNENAQALDYAKRAAQTADAAGAAMAKSWAWNFQALAEMQMGEVERGFARMEDSYQGAVAGGHRFQATNAVYNAIWTAIELGSPGHIAAWSPRVGPIRPSDVDSAPPYLRAVLALHEGRVSDAIPLARTALQRSRDAQHEKQVWRCLIILGQALAEAQRPAEAAEVMPPVSSRVELQDAVYHTTACVRLKLAAGDAAGAFADARIAPQKACQLASPVDSVAEAADDPAWLREFIDGLPIQGEVLTSPRLAAAKGRLALMEGRFEDAVALLGKALADLARGAFLLDGWHVGRALAEAEFRAGDVEGARRRLAGIVTEATLSGALLAARLARDTAIRLGLEMEPSPQAAEDTVTAARVATGERMVSVLFADVRGYTELSGHGAPADIAERIASLQRWATQEVQRRHGIVDKFAGDAIMATFNVSGQSVDHSVQALRAAVAIIDKAALAELPVGAAVAVGPAVVGSLATSANVSVLGEVTNLASRLQAQAAAGQVILTEEVYRRAKEWLDAQRVQIERVEVALKGFDSPVVAYRVTTGVVIPAPA